MKKIWITGAEGHIGTALLELLEGVEYQLLPTDIHEVDITKIDEVTQFVYVNRPDVIINCAGMTDVAECEKNIDEAYRVNAIGVRNVALAANDIDAKVIQISTDDVFDKESRIPYNEFDTVHPRTIYGKSKEAGEKILTQLLNRFVIIRSSWIYGIGRDFVDEVLRNAAKGGTMEVPNNQYAAPTSAFELARVICHFIDNEVYGLYHVVCPGSCSRYEFEEPSSSIPEKPVTLISTRLSHAMMSARPFRGFCCLRWTYFRRRGSRRQAVRQASASGG